MILVTLEDIKNKELNQIQNICADRQVIYSPSIDTLKEEQLGHVDILITYGDELSLENLELLPKLKWIQLFQAGAEKLPLEAINKRNIKLTNMKTIHAIPMSEFALGVMLRHSLKLEVLRKNQEKRHWDTTATIEELSGKQVAIFGAGEVGSAIATKCKLMGMHVIGVNRSGRIREPFHEMETLANRQHVIPRCDYIILTMPVTDQTKHCFSTAEFTKMKQNALFINLGRGPLVDDTALKTALLNKTIGGAVLDVFDEEPLDPNHDLWGIDRLFITPHIAAKSPHYIKRCLDIFEKQYDAFLKNKNLQFEISLDEGY
ncbi:D-2-hydroxyacid dehydrogenase [Evansella halocellulosilytica]|uniref:D-2-hydroxyacid dehydrogenase n=1 Tax=Evansella halocellulosilytica TaxID=2011013 RepID=UPI0015C70B08|nr:D-2-hydroxyacid dehydrogenase [Evansella halocellulosilytica]